MIDADLLGGLGSPGAVAAAWIAYILFVALVSCSVLVIWHLLRKKED
ncbi:MAG: hypothetical protein BWY68_00336 [bacterium ADurb.Bin400]|nr:MAG: hypothetical protein BWY68_00336 [bacterium ADurb.Bin400]